LHDGYPLPEELARHAREGAFAPEELRRACQEAGRGREDAGEARFRPAAEMVELWRGLDPPAWGAPYALRDTRLGYLRCYDEALVSSRLTEGRVERAARARWGSGWPEKLEAAREGAAHRCRETYAKTSLEDHRAWRRVMGIRLYNTQR
jgi:hypothetical protein